ncbi:PHB depolymerase family esterase [Streptomyces sp. YIM 98790]|uniref:extracellular catalytic domain type 1 short-chain-length polyhydroxyalkanoate depolymerase n=1 Tax=Streptomyces sp. YIM 98790 TaxID=2689077 RepID=UPI001A9F5750|nr:PHB depolymerase family esterase [Streptomyces sp. YIM 98790]
MPTMPIRRAAPRHGRRRRLIPLTALLGMLATLLLVPAGPAHAASLTQVTGFGSNPGNLTMHRYVPDGLPSGRPVVVLLHGCAQGPADYFANSGWQKYADAYGFTVVAAGQQTGNNSSRCFNWFEPGDTRRGQGEALSIRQMVDRVLRDQSADPARVYLTGLSAGGAMTAAMLAAYPDVFAGGAVIAGLPHGCATSMIEAFSCMNPGRTRTAAAWGDLVRSAHPGYSGRRPAVSLWHGGADYTVATANLTESVKQWTNVHATDTTGDATSSLPASTTRTEYRNASGEPVVVSYLTADNGHGTPVAPGGGTDQCGQAAAYFLSSVCSSYHIAQDWNLSGTAPGPGPEPGPEPDPEPEPEPGPDPEPPLSCVTASNYAHTQAGRAVHRYGYAYAVGSGDNLGLWSLAVTTSVTETAPGHWTRTAACP